MSSNANNPRKFSEKIALQQQKLVEQQREFDAVMREVEDVTKKKGSPPILDNYGDPGLEYAHVQNFQPTHFNGPLSLPDYSTASPGSRGIDLADALRNLQSLTHHSPLSVDYGDRVFMSRHPDSNPAFCKPHRCEPEMSQGLASPMLGSQQNIHGSVMPFGMQPPGSFLPVPLESNWRRTHSDSSLHATVMGTNASTSVAAGGSPSVPVSNQMTTDNMCRDRRRQHFNSKTRSTEQYNNGYVPSVPYSLVSPMASLSFNKPSSIRSPEPAMHSPTGVDGMCGAGGNDVLKRFDSASSLVPVNGGGNGTTLEQQATQNLQHSMPRVPNHQAQYDSFMISGDSGGYPSMPPPAPSHGMRGLNPVTAMIGSADSALLNTSSLPDLTVALARGSAQPSGFPISDQFNEMNNNSRSPSSRVHKHRTHMRPPLLNQRNQQHLMSYLVNGGRSVSHADMVALSADNSLSNSSGGPLGVSNAQSIGTQGGSGGGVVPLTVGRYQPQQPQAQQQQFERRFERISMDPTSSFNYQSQQLQQMYQMYPDQQQQQQQHQQMVGLNQRIPEICIETAEDQLHHQQLLQHGVSPVLNVAQQQQQQQQQQQEFCPSPVGSTHQQFSPVPQSSSPMVDRNSGMYYEQPMFDNNMVGTSLPLDLNSVLNDGSNGSYGQQQQQQQSQFYMAPSPSSAGSSIAGLDHQQQQQTFQSWQS